MERKTLFRKISKNRQARVTSSYPNTTVSQLCFLCFQPMFSPGSAQSFLLQLPLFRIQNSHNKKIAAGQADPWKAKSAAVELTDPQHSVFQFEDSNLIPSLYEPEVK
jgi:hypothetical protein